MDRVDRAFGLGRPSLQTEYVIPTRQHICIVSQSFRSSLTHNSGTFRQIRLNIQWDLSKRRIRVFSDYLCFLGLIVIMCYLYSLRLKRPS